MSSVRYWNAHVNIYKATLAPAQNSSIALHRMSHGTIRLTWAKLIATSYTPNPISVMHTPLACPRLSGASLHCARLWLQDIAAVPEWTKFSVYSIIGIVGNIWYPGANFSKFWWYRALDAIDAELCKVWVNAAVAEHSIVACSGDIERVAFTSIVPSGDHCSSSLLFVSEFCPVAWINVPCIAYNVHLLVVSEQLDYLTAWKGFL